MSWRNWKSLVVSCALVAGLTVEVGACSSSSGGSSTPTPVPDAGTEPVVDASHPVQHRDASFETGSAETGSAETGSVGPVGTFDGTTGLPCTSDAVCTGTGANAAGVNKCSITGYFAAGALDPTPVCLSTALCDLGDGTTIQFCDSADPTDPTSPGICLNVGNGATGLFGQCFPQCQVLADGSAPIGCQGRDTCNVVAFAPDTSGQPVALGFCFGGCTADSDCPTGNVCQKDQGICVTTLKTATKTIGQVCSANDVSLMRYGCNCALNQTTMLGYCSQSCIVGANSGAECPSGYVCDALLASQINGLDGGLTTGFTQQNAGLAGLCLQSCGGAGDAGDSGGQTCGATSTCLSQTAAGSDCVP
jgi:hypothetical protein